MIPLRQSTGTVLRVQLINPSDGVSPAVGIDETDVDVANIYKDGSSMPVDILANLSSTTSTDGVFVVLLTSSETDTVGLLSIAMVGATAFIPVQLECVVLPANVYDAMVGSANLAVDTVAISGDATAANNLELAYDGTGYAHNNNTYSGVTLAADQSAVASMGAIDISTSNINVTLDGVIDANIVSADANALDAEDFASDVTFGVDAAGIRSAIGLASANLDTQLGAIPTLVELQAELTGLEIEASTYTKDKVSKKRTWSWTGNSESITSPNIITESASFAGELKFDLTGCLNPGAGILTITSVTVSPSGPTIGDSAKTSDNLKVIFETTGGTAGTTYTYTVNVSTTDCDTALVRKGIFVAE